MTIFWYRDLPDSVQSNLTRNIVFVNPDPKRFLILPSNFWNSQLLSDGVHKFKYSNAWTNPAKRSPVFVKAVRHFFEDPNPETISELLDQFMTDRGKWGVAGMNSSASRRIATPWYASDKSRIKDILQLCWRAGVLIYPRDELPEFRQSWVTETLDWHDDLDKALEEAGTRATGIKATLDRALLSAGPIVDCGDIVPEVVNSLSWKKEERFRVRPVLRALVKVLSERFGNEAPTLDSYLPRPAAKKDDLSFDWIIDLDPGLTEWAKLAVLWLSEAKTQLGRRQQVLRIFLEALASASHLPRNPQELLVSTWSKSLRELLAHLDPARFNLFNDFLTWVKSHVSLDGHLPASAYRSEVEGPSSRLPYEQRSETTKNVMPPQLLEYLVECLTENGWAWAQTAMGTPTSSSKGDWFFKTYGNEWAWSPVRSTCLYAKLTFASRQGQTRHLDSGEADSQIALNDPSAPEGRRWEMKLNLDQIPRSVGTTNGESAGDMAKGAVQVAVGERSNFLRLRFPTNKTADRDKQTWNRGYTSPWMPERLAHKLVELRNWQRANNPVAAATAWSEVSEFNSGTGWIHPDVLGGLKSTFLFRDPTSEKPSHPITDKKLRNMHGALCLEVERRCAAAGIVSEDGKPIKLVETLDKHGGASGLVYSVHSVRASIITHFIEDGGVSPDVMMKIVGHANVVMLLYYTKHSEKYVAEAVLTGAEQVDRSRRKWVRDALGKEVGDLRDMAVAKGGVSAQLLRAAPPSSLLTMNVGLCTKGGAHCHEGGDLIVGRKHEELYGPVIGGRSNCAACRFLLTGEPWLEGIVSEFNLRSLDLSLKNQQLSSLDERLLPLDDERLSCMRDGRVFERYSEWRSLKMQKDEIEAAQLQLHGEMVGLLTLSQQIGQLSRKRAATGKANMALVAGDMDAVETALQESTEFDLVDRICRSADVYPSLATRGSVVVAASLFRGRTWDRVLKKLGLEPRFLDLSPDEARHTGNRVTEWLEMRVGRRATLALMEGSESFHSICTRTGFVSQDFLASLEQALNDQVPLRLRLSGHG